MKTAFDTIFKLCLIAVLTALVYVIHESVEQSRYKPLPNSAQIPIFDSKDNRIYYYQPDIGYFYTKPDNTDITIKDLPK